jgi:Tfp pilus assembly protein PilV
MINNLLRHIREVKRAGGFTLIETLLAVLLLTTAIAGPLTIASRGLMAAVVAKDQITAFYLAQDAIEYVRFVRDTSCLTAGAQAVAGGCPRATWLSRLAPCISADGSVACVVDSIQDTICAYASCGTELKYDTTNKFFSYTAGVELPQHYTRRVYIKYDSAGTTPDEATVTVSVSWQDLAGVTHPPITIRENLLRWQ